MSEASEFAYDQIFKLGPYRFYKIAKRHSHLVVSEGWKRFWIEKKCRDGSWKIIYGPKRGNE